MQVDPDPDVPRGMGVEWMQGGEGEQAAPSLDPDLDMWVGTGWSQNRQVGRGVENGLTLIWTGTGVGKGSNQAPIQTCRGGAGWNISAPIWTCGWVVGATQLDLDAQGAGRMAQVKLNLAA